MDHASDDSPDLVPARILNEFAYCPRLAYIEWVQGEFADSADTVEGGTSTGGSTRNRAACRPRTSWATTNCTRARCTCRRHGWAWWRVSISSKAMACSHAVGLQTRRGADVRGRVGARARAGVRAGADS